MGTPLPETSGVYALLIYSDANELRMVDIRLILESPRMSPVGPARNRHQGCIFRSVGGELVCVP